jgi:hypothetical protein
MGTRMAKLIAEARKQTTVKYSQDFKSGEFVEVLKATDNLNVGDYAVVLTTDGDEVTCECIETGKIGKLSRDALFRP